MKNKKILLLICLAFVLLIAGASVLYNSLSKELAPDQLAVQESAEESAGEDSESEDTEPELMLAPDFTVYDVDGNEVSLSDYMGKPVVVNFWASWCGPCKMEMPDFQEKYLELGEEVNFVMVNMTTGRETQEKAAAFIAEKGYTFPVFYDTAGEAVEAYGVYSLPSTYFIDSEGYAIAQAVGAIDAETLQRGIDMIAGEEAL